MILTKEDLQELVNSTLYDLNAIHKFATKEIYARLNISKQFVFVWIDDKQIPILFNIKILSHLESDVRGFFKYVKSQLRKAGVECQKVLKEHYIGQLYLYYFAYCLIA